MITLYGFSRVMDQVVGHTRDLRAQWALEETGLPYRVEGLDWCAGELKKPAFHRVNAFEQVPVIDDDGFVVAESAAIALYVAEKAGTLIPSDLQGRTAVTQWCFVAMNSVEPFLLELAIMPKDHEPAIDKHRAMIRDVSSKRLAVLDERLADRRYLATDEFSVADLLMVHIVREARTTGLLDDRPRVTEYLERCEARPAWQRTRAAYEDRMGVARGSIP